MKKPWLSKTLWTNVVIAVAAFFPIVRDWISANPAVMAIGFSVINLVLRAITKDEIGLE